MSLSINLGALRNPPVLLKFLETVLGAICFGLLVDLGEPASVTHEHALLFMAVFAFLLTTSLLLVSSILSSTVADMIPNTIFEFLYHLTALVMYAVASINFSVLVSKENESSPEHSQNVSVVVLSIANSVFYGISTYFSFQSYRSS